MLVFAEELLLLALHDEKGTVVTNASMALPFGLAGALLADLILGDRLHLEDGKVTVISTATTGNEILDEALAMVAQSKKDRKLDHWIGKLSGMKDLRNRLLDRLVQEGILRRDEHRVLWVFPSHRYPTQEASPELLIRERIRAVILYDTEPDARTSMLISLANACELWKEILDREERKQAKARIKEIVQGEPIGKAIADAVAILIVTVTTPAAIAAT